MADERFIVAIGRIERALSKIEKMAITPATSEESALALRHEQLKTETAAAILDIDRILAGAA
jgi:hypothetical protein